MTLTQVEFEKTGSFSPLFLDYLNKKEALAPFYNVFPTIENFQKLIDQREEFPSEKRHTLVKVLLEQYGGLDKTGATEHNIHALGEPNTFTITTGHQLNIFTGPLYFIYKIVTVVNACKKLKAQYPAYNFVPVYWMASEDHDIAEISSFNLFGKKHQWQTEQTGAAGRLLPHSLDTIIKELPEVVTLFEKAYLDHDTLADAVRYYVNKLFGEYGLLVLDADHRQLKSEFGAVIKTELLTQVSNELVVKDSKALDAAGYKSQAFSREINLFYLEGNIRERIVKENDQFKVLNTDLSFSEAEIIALVERKPELFSPNVILRPVYQETILPNLAYSGGPAEIAYWFQLKSVFEKTNTFFPALLPRSFAMVINKAQAKKADKLELNPVDIFKSTNQLKEEFLTKNSDNDFDLTSEKKLLTEFFESLKQKATLIDGSLTGFIGAEGAKSFKSLDTISKRMKKAEEQNNETAMSQIDSLKEKLFPNGSLQERHDNFLNFYLNNPNFINEVLHHFDAFEFKFNILKEG
jgi:bacillithiol biosynthesis cysteine-adding enzyme BshC